MAAVRPRLELVFVQFSFDEIHEKNVQSINNRNKNEIEWTDATSAKCFADFVLSEISSNSDQVHSTICTQRADGFLARDKQYAK